MAATDRRWQVNAALDVLLSWVLGNLGQLLVSLIAQMRKARADNPELIAAVSKAVAEAEANASWNGPQKRGYVYAAVVSWCKDFGIDVRDSVINVLIELAVVQITPATKA